MKKVSRLWAEGAFLTVITGSWAPNGVNNPVATSILGQGFSVVSGATGSGTAGLAKITYTEKYASLISFNCTLGYGTAGDQLAVPRAYVAATATALATQEVVNWDISAIAIAEWSAAGANYRVNFIAVFKKSATANI